MVDIDAQGQRPTLRRELKVWQVAGISIAAMAPTLGMAFTGAGAAGLVGRAVPLTFVLATIGVLFIASGFVILSRHYSHAGSAYALVGTTLGPRAGFFSGWALTMAYSLYTPASIIGGSSFLALFCDTSGIWNNAPWWPFAIVMALLLWRAAVGDVRRLMQVLLSIEGVSIALLLILIVTIFGTLAGGGDHDGASLTLKVFVLPSGVGLHDLGLAVVFGIVAFGGFEAAATLGEEARDPRRAVPRGLLGATIGVAIFYIVCTTAQSLGFGATEAGAKTFAASSGPIFDLADSYMGTWMVEVLEVAAAISAFGAALGTLTAGSRLVFALGRDGLPKSPIGKASGKSGEPIYAIGVEVTILGLGIVLAQSLSLSGIDALFYYATIATLSILVVYALVNVSAVKYLSVGSNRNWQLLIPCVAILFVAYVMYNQVYPVPASPYNVFPYVTAGWLLVGLLIVVLTPGLARQIGSRLIGEATESLDAPGGETASGGTAVHDRPAEGR